MAIITVKTPHSEMIISALKGETIAAALERGGISLPRECGGKGRCGKCRVTIAAGLLTNTVLACNTIILGDLSVIINSDKPYDEYSESIIEKKKESNAPKSEIIKSNDRHSTQSVVCRDQSCPKEVCISADQSPLSETDVAKEYGSARAVRAGRVGIAIDLGTTVIEAALYDLDSGKIVRSLKRLNIQRRFGADAASRINAYAEGYGKELTCGIRQQLTEIIVELIKAAAVGDAEKIVVAGNNTMLHILAGENPEFIGKYPFKPSFTRHKSLFLQNDGFKCKLTLLPSVSGYVGADALSGAFGSFTEAPSELLIDLGTNGEFVLKTNGKLYCASAACGPAFEGAETECGMSALEGAVYSASVSGEKIVLGVIGDTAPVGLCGSGLIDVISVMLDEGIIAADGAFKSDYAGKFVDAVKDSKFYLTQFDMIAEKLNENEKPNDDEKSNEIEKPNLAEQANKTYKINKAENNSKTSVYDAAQNRGFAYTGNCECSNMAAVYVSQKDIRAYQLAKSAVFTGICSLLEFAGSKPGDVDKIYISGGFGSYLNLNNAASTGMLPAEFLGKTQIAGNTSLKGASLALFDDGIIEKEENAAAEAEVLNLNDAPGFNSRFIENLTLVNKTEIE